MSLKRIFHNIFLQVNTFQKMRIFISGINSQLGFHLVESLRQDHKLLEGYCQISGSKTKSGTQQQYQIHNSITKIFDFNKDRDLTVKQAVSADVIIFDVRYHPHEQIQFILNVLKHYNLKKPLKIIGISNFMTWSNSKTSEFTSIPYDKQTLLQFATGKQNWKTTENYEENYKTRVSHPMFSYNYQLQQMILSLKYNNRFIKSHVLCIGVLYGKSGFDLRQHIQNSIKSQQSCILSLKAQKLINTQSLLPFIHIDKLLRTVQDIVYKQNQLTNQNTEYKFVCQEKCQSIVQILQKINGQCGNLKAQTSNENEIKQIIPVEQKPKQRRQSVLKHNASINNNLLTVASQQAPVSSRPSQPSIPQQSSAGFIPELYCQGNKSLLSLLSNVNLVSKPHCNSIDQNQKKSMEDSGIIPSINNYQQDSVIKTKVQDKQFQMMTINSTASIKNVIREFLQSYQIDFKRFLVPEEIAFSQFQSTQQHFIFQQMMSKHFVLNKSQMNAIFNTLLQKGQILNQRMLTPEQKKQKIKKRNEDRQSIKKQHYELFFKEILIYFLKNKCNSNFIICLKHQFIEKILNILSQLQFEQFNGLKFINITSAKQQYSNSYNNSKNIQACAELFSDQFFSVVGIQKPSQNTVDSQVKQDQSNPIEDKQVQNLPKTKTQVKNNKQESDQGEQVKINLISQYLLDNLIVYTAQAKQQLKLKGYLKNGQKFEGKDKIKLFIQELKNIRQRQLLQVNEQDDQRS